MEGEEVEEGKGGIEETNEGDHEVHRREAHLGGESHGPHKKKKISRPNSQRK